MIKHNVPVARDKSSALWRTLLVSVGLLIVACLGLLRASAITMMIVVEEERACRRILESGIVNYKAASELIQNFPAPNANSSSGHIAFRRHFFDDNLLQQCRRQYEVCAVLVVVATLLVGVAVIAISRVRVAPSPH